MWEYFFPGSSKLIEIRGNYHVGETLCRPFSRVEDYGDDWRHPETGVGPLYIIDECHKSVPRVGTPVSVEEWFAEHRHEGADVLLITQSYGKINQAIRDAVQLVYRCKKAVAFGSSDRYIRKVQDGLRGEVVNTQIRQYESKYFPLYTSHTKSNDAVAEAFAEDVVPIWKRWPFLGAGICFVLFFVIVGFILSKDPKSPKASPKADPIAQQALPDHLLLQTAQPLAAPVDAQPRGPEKRMHPYDGSTMHLQALVHGKRSVDGSERDYLSGYVVIAQNGQGIRQVSFDDLRTAGYEITYQSNTVISVTFQGYDIGYVVADLPQIALASKLPTADIAKK
jgi:zona occludens toxin